MNLELVESKALIRELLRRYDHGVVAVMRTGERAAGVHSYERLWRGNSHTAAGLAMDLIMEILLVMRAEQMDAGPGELVGGEEPEANGG